MNEYPNDTLRNHGKSFYWASRLLPSSVTEDVTRFYAYCRNLDDAIDIHKNISCVVMEQNALHNNLSTISSLLVKYKIPVSLVHAFLETLKLDIAPVKIHTIDELLKYSYGVAGTVGAIMCHILGNNDQSSIYRAIDLGIAMQLTNIARDVFEDSQEQRIYIPDGYSQISIVELAEAYYKSGIEGIYKLPKIMRPAIMTAAYVYREIGMQIKTTPEIAQKQRMIVKNSRKIGLTFYAVAKSMRYVKHSNHDATLHIPLAKLPCCHEY